jgi:uncharacterized membrane protein YkoI
VICYLFATPGLCPVRGLWGESIFSGDNAATPGLPQAIRDIEDQIMEHENSELSGSRRLSIILIGMTAVLIGSLVIFADHAGADSSGVLDDGAHLVDDVSVEPNEAIAIALAGNPGDVRDVDLEQHGLEIIYEIEIDDVTRYVDANTGEALIPEYDNDDDFSSRLDDRVLDS